MAVYSRFVDLAERLLLKYGSPGELIKEVHTEGTPWEPGGTVEKHYKIQAVATEFRETGESIKLTDKRLVISAKGLPVNPEPNDIVVAGGVRYNVISVIEKRPAGTTITFELQGRI